MHQVESRVHVGVTFAGALVTLIVPSAVLVGVSCTDGQAMPDTAVEISITTDKTDYGPGEPIVLRVEVTNGTDEPVVLEFSTGQRYDFVMDGAEGGTAWRWSADKAFIPRCWAKNSWRQVSHSPMRSASRDHWSWALTPSSPC